MKKKKTRPIPDVRLHILWLVKKVREHAVRRYDLPDRSRALTTSEDKLATSYYWEGYNNALKHVEESMLRRAYREASR